MKKTPTETPIKGNKLTVSSLSKELKVSRQHLTNLFKENKKSVKSFTSHEECVKWVSSNTKKLQEDVIVTVSLDDNPDEAVKKIDMDEDYEAIVVKQAKFVQGNTFKLLVAAQATGNIKSIEAAGKVWAETTKQTNIILTKFDEYRKSNGLLIETDKLNLIIGNELKEINTYFVDMGDKLAMKVSPENPDRAKQVLDEYGDACTKSIYFRLSNLIKEINLINESEKKSKIA